MQTWWQRFRDRWTKPATIEEFRDMLANYPKLIKLHNHGILTDRETIRRYRRERR